MYNKTGENFMIISNRLLYNFKHPDEIFDSDWKMDKKYNWPYALLWMNYCAENLVRDDSGVRE